MQCTDSATVNTRAMCASVEYRQSFPFIFAPLHAYVLKTIPSSLSHLRVHSEITNVQATNTYQNQWRI